MAGIIKANDKYVKAYFGGEIIFTAKVFLPEHQTNLVRAALDALAVAQDAKEYNYVPHFVEANQILVGAAVASQNLEAAGAKIPANPGPLNAAFNGEPMSPEVFAKYKTKAAEVAKAAVVGTPPRTPADVLADLPAGPISLTYTLTEQPLPQNQELKIG